MQWQRKLHSLPVRILALIVVAPWACGTFAPQAPRSPVRGATHRHIERATDSHRPADALLLRDTTPSAPASPATRGSDVSHTPPAILPANLPFVPAHNVAHAGDARLATSRCALHIVLGVLLI